MRFLSISLFKRSPLAFLRRGIFIQVEDTPNEHALKFIPGKPVTAGLDPEHPFYRKTVEFTSSTAANLRLSRLARELFRLDGLDSVMFGPDFISISKNPQTNWDHLKAPIFAAIMDQFQETQKQQPLLENAETEDGAKTQQYSELEAAILEILDSRIRPVIQADGGDVEFVGMTESGWVQLRLRGACRSCSSSTVTLRNGIESMLMYYCPEVKGVEQVE